MPIIAPFEQLAMEKGMEKGSLQATRSILLEILAERFGEIPAMTVDSINAIENVSALRSILKQAVKAGALETIQPALDEAKEK